MESSYTMANITNQSINGTSEDINFDVPLFATYLSIFSLLMAMPLIIIPAALVIHIISKTAQLHTIYYLFVVNLLVTDILNTCKMVFEVILMCLYLFGINADTTVSFIIYIILSIPRLAARLSFINLAIDRAVAVAFPYRHKSIMTKKRAYVMLIITWIISSFTSLAIYFSSPFAFVGSFGVYTPVTKSIGRVILTVVLLVSTVILIICVNVYLCAKINQSRQRLEENMRMYGTDGRNDDQEIKIKQLKRTYHKFQKQIKINFSLFVLGGVDGIINIFTLMLLIVMNRFLSVSVNLYATQFVAYPLLCVQLISHSLLYGTYMKDIRRKLCKCYLYQRLKRTLPLCPSKVTVLNQS